MIIDRKTELRVGVMITIDFDFLVEIVNVNSDVGRDFSACTHIIHIRYVLLL